MHKVLISPVFNVFCVFSFFEGDKSINFLENIINASIITKLLLTNTDVLRNTYNIVINDAVLKLFKAFLSALVLKLLLFVSFIVNNFKQVLMYSSSRFNFKSC